MIATVDHLCWQGKCKAVATVAWEVGVPDSQVLIPLYIYMIDLTWLVSYSQVPVYRKITLELMDFSYLSWVDVDGMSHARPGWMSIFWRPVMRDKTKSCGLTWGLLRLFNTVWFRQCWLNNRFSANVICSDCMLGTQDLCVNCLLDFQGPIWVKLVHPWLSLEKSEFPADFGQPSMKDV